MTTAARNTARQANHLYLTGFMGSGKTSVGQQLAMRLSRDFIDLDHELARREGRTIADIWESEGEPMFRRMENELFAELTLMPEPAVIATGGGTILDPVNYGLGHRTGLWVYLIVDFNTAIHRITHGKDRPLYDDGDPVGNREQLRKLFHQRLPYYRQADLHTDGTNGSPQEIAGRICATLPVPCVS